MDGEQEQQCSETMRNLARQYAEGRFNKEEYRSRRRALIAKCSGEEEITQDMPTLKLRTLEDEQIALRTNKLARLLGGVSLVLMAVMGVVIYYLKG